MALFATSKAVAQLAFRLGELDTEVRNLKSANKHLQLEWEELYDKVRRQMARMSKRSAVDERERNDAEVIEPGDEGVDPLRAKILARRSFLRAQG